MSADAKEWIGGMKPTLAMSMWAVRDAALASGRFPVVIYAPSFSAMSWENADICEYLATHGFVVIASPDMGVATRGMTDDLAGIGAQARDISFLIGYAQTLPDTDMSEIAVAGFSWGGISNLFAAARDNRIDALVALDGSMRYYAGLVKQAGDVHPEQMTIPLLFFAQGEITLEDQDRYFNTDKAKNEGPNVLNAWTHGDLVTVHMLGLIHTEHSSMYQRNEEVWKHYPEVRKADYDREDGITGYAWIARYTLQFLDAYLKHDAAAMAYLKKTPAENGVPKHFMTVNFRPAKGVSASMEAFRTELGRQGFVHAAGIYAAMQKDKSDFKLDESSVNSWSDELISDNHLTEAISLLKLNVQMYPDSSGAYYSLGEAYLKSGQRQLAIESYKKSLEKDSTNDDARQKLKDLDEAGKPPAQ
jgi:dienelactone hydrolase/predicted negative regulator of RcsB-dependent stress response